MKHLIVLAALVGCGGDDPATPSDGSPADTSSTNDDTLDDGTYRAATWTCTGSSGTVDVIAFATSIQLAQIRLVVNGTDGQTESDGSGAPACTRTIGQTFSYPSAGTVTLTSDANFTCSATCAPAACTSGAQPVIVDTFEFEKTTPSPTTYAFTRTSPAPIGLQLAAGCQAGGTEAISWAAL